MTCLEYHVFLLHIECILEKHQRARCISQHRTVYTMMMLELWRTARKHSLYRRFACGLQPAGIAQQCSSDISCRQAVGQPHIPT